MDRRIGVDGARAQTAQQSERRLLALEIAAEPEEIVGGAARQVAEHAHDAHLLRRRQQASSTSTGSSASTQTSAGFDAFAHRNGARVGLVGNAQKPPGITLQPFGVTAA